MNGTVARTTLIILATGILLGGACHGTERENAATKQDESLCTTRNGGIRFSGTNEGHSPGVGRRTGEVPPGYVYLEQPQSTGRQPPAGKGNVRAAMEKPATTSQTISRGDVPAAGNEHSDSLGVFKVSAYTAGHESTGKRPGDKGYGITSTGTRVRENYTIAADWKVLPPGTKLSIEGLPYVYVVEDSGNFTGSQLDLYIPKLDDALAWGVQERGVTVLEWGRN